MTDGSEVSRLRAAPPRHRSVADPAAYHQAFHDVVTGDNSLLWSTGVVVGYNSRPPCDLGATCPAFAGLSGAISVSALDRSVDR